jgi:hypothetical protein
MLGPDCGAVTELEGRGWVGLFAVLPVLVIAAAIAFAVAMVTLPGRRNRLRWLYQVVVPESFRRRAWVRRTHSQFEQHRRDFPKFHEGADRIELSLKGRPIVAIVSERIDPIQARRINLRLVVEALESAGVEYFAIRGPDQRKSVIGVRESLRAEASRALSDLLRTSGGYFRVFRREASTLGPTIGTEKLRLGREGVTAVGVFWYRRNAQGHRLFGSRYACEIEFWTEDDGQLVASRRNPICDAVPGDSEFVSIPDTTLIPHVQYPTPPDEFRVQTVAPFDTRIIGDVLFPIDAVFTWVDGEDPQWLERRKQAAGLEYHPEAGNPSRYLSQDELKYALRSVGMFAPWIRNIFIVTDKQVPTWLDLEVPGIRVVDHTEIFTDADALPTFNSHAIESQIHHIDGLSEHFLYLNDDMMFASDVFPQSFFEANGLTKYFPSPMTVPPGPPTAEDPPVVAAAKNNRALLADLLGGAIVRRLKHAPYAIRRSVMFEIEETFADLFEATAHARVRSTADLSTLSSLYHYYAFAKGFAVPGRIRFRYVDLGEPDAEERLAKIAEKRVQQAICLNMTKSASEGISSAAVNGFLDTYFNTPSKFER